MYEVILLCFSNEEVCPTFHFECEEDVERFVKYCFKNYYSVKINYKKTDKDNTCEIPFE